MIKETPKGTVLGGALLVAGTAIGGGMLALPILTSAGGFFPAIVIFLFCWLFMAATGLLLMEVFLWSKKEVNLVSMSEMCLGAPGKVAAWLLYLFLFYSLTVAYVSGGGSLIGDVIEILSAHTMLSWGKWVGSVLFVLLFAPFVIIGNRAVDRINSILMVGLILSFLIFVFLGITHIRLDMLTRLDWKIAFFAMPVMFTSFAFQGIVPTLTNYLDRKPAKVKMAILIGSACPLVVYIIWEALILGVVPMEGLFEARKCGQTAVSPLKNVLELPWLYRVGEFFAFFAIITSFLGVTLGLLDFLADGLKVKKTLKGRTLLALLIFFPPLLITMINPSIFLNALCYAGGLGCALLLGLLPILMVWRGRYSLKYKSEYSLFGGRVTLSLLILFICLELFFMIITAST